MAAQVVKPEVCKSWEKTGKREFLSLCKAELTQWNGDGGLLKRALYEMCWYVLRGSLSKDQATAAFLDIADLHEDIPSLVADVLSIIDVETLSHDEEKDETRDKFLALTSACTGLVSEGVLKERLDQETLESLGLLVSKAQFSQKYVKTKTKLYYKQQKFNLLREEMEGYSKLITELKQEFAPNTHLHVLENIKCLIGCFNLDPVRVLDVILEIVETCPASQHSFFLQLLRDYTTEQHTICHILGFKFHYYQVSEGSETPSTLYQVAALLIKNQLVDLETLYPHLIPSDSEMIGRHKKDIEEAKLYARRMTVVSLADKEKTTKEADKVTVIDVWQNNQKLGVVEALLGMGDWEHGRWIMDRFPPYLVTSQQAVAQALTQLIHVMLEPLYAHYNGLPPAIQKRRTVHAAVPGCRQVSTFGDLRDHVFPILRYLGPNVAYDPTLMVKLLRLAKAFMSKRGRCDDPCDLADLEDTFRGFLTITDELLFPALSLLPAHCCMAEEMWSFIKLLKYEYRYRLYGQWKNDSNKLHPRLMKAQADSLDKAKYIMKRLAKENVKPLGRQIGKLSHSNPGVMFEYILTQIQKYDNFIGPVVDSLKFLTNLSYDVLAYCIIEALANPERERMKFDDTNISLWLQSLAAFSGAIFKKYQIELTGLLQYVANQLKAGKSYDLLILREVITKMAGIEVTEEITDDQLACMGGGDLLRAEGGQYSQVRNMKKSASRLKDVLIQHNLAIPLCLLMAQERHGIIFQGKYDDTDKRHLKLMGKLYDQCHDTFVQFSSFLGSQLSIEELRQRLPSMKDLMAEYYLTADTAFPICRMLYTHSVHSKYDELRKADKKDKSASSSAKMQRYTDAWGQVLGPVAEELRPLVPEKIWEDLSPGFYVTFWMLSMYDLHVPSAAYEKQVNQMKSQLIAIEENKDLNPSKKKREKERCIAVIEKLQEEEKKQQEHVNRVLARLKHSKDTWFVTGVHKHATITALIQLCLFPRCCVTANDALYCAKFLYILHNLRTPNFSSLICYDRHFSDITWAMTSCTENEAHRYGRFLNAILDDIMHWHSDKAIFEKECGSYPGFKTVFRKESQNSVADQLDYENYRHVVHKWHYSLAKVMVFCLESGDYIQIRNALIVLTKILPNYPRIIKFGHALERRLDRVCTEEKEKRPDIYALAMGYSTLLKRGKKAWISDADFHVIDKKAPARNAAASKEDHKATEKSGGDSKRGDKEIKKEIKREPREKSDRSSRESSRKEPEENGASEKKDKEESKPKDRSKDRERGKDKEREKEKEKKMKDKKKEKEEKKERKEEKLKEEQPRKESRREKERDDESRSSSSKDVRSRERRADRSSSVASSESMKVRSADPSPRHAEYDNRDRESKRRKIESSKEREERDIEHKRVKIEDGGGSSSKSSRVANGSGSAPSSESRGSRHKASSSSNRSATESERERYNREREREWGAAAMWDDEHMEPVKKRKESPDVRDSSRRSSDKHKKSKHH